MGADYDYGNGNNWLVSQWAYVTDDPESAGSVVFVQRNRGVWFDKVGSDYSARYGAEHTLTHDAAENEFVVTSPTGEVWRLHDFTQTDDPPGLFKSFTLRSGLKIEATSYTANDRIEEVQRIVTEGSTTTIESFQYDYFTSGPQQGRLQYATLRRDVDYGGWTELRRAAYEYYGDSESHGSPGDLKRVTQQAFDGSSWNDLNTSYYRYYKQGDPAGSAYLLKYIVQGESYARLAAAVGDPLSASDAQVAGYADYYFEYDGENRVTKETVAAGSRTYTFAYTGSAHLDDVNKWNTKTVETLPDDSQNIVYTNFLGQLMVREHLAGSDRWIEYRQYNSDAHQTLAAQPSAVTGYDELQADLDVTLKANDGLIHVTDYYTTSGGGAAKGEVECEKIKRGSGGTAIKLRAYEYAERTVGTTTVHQVSKETVYRNDDGTGAIDTTYSYTWHSGTVQLEQRVTTLPAVPASQNGSGTSNTVTERFDMHGNLIWIKDERGFLHRNQYDAATGALIQTIQDVDTTQVTDEPTGWTTPSGGGKHIISDFEHDSLGRITQELGPEHEVDIDGTATDVRTASWTVYDDANNEVRTAQDYATGASWDTFTLVNPVSITKLDRAGRTLEEIQATRASASGKLTASDTFAQSSYVRWSTNSYDDQRRLQHTRVYHTIPTSGAGSSGTNYDQTSYGYDSMARQNKVTSPGGTITRTVFRTVGRIANPSHIYVGTDDTSATESDPTGGGATGNNMVMVSESEFDSGNDGGDDLLTKQTEHVDSSTKRETSYLYDWRNRQTGVDGEEDFYQKSTYNNLDQVTRVDRHDTTSAGNLIARSETFYDDLGRVHQTKRYAVNVVTGTVGNSLTDNTWYDESGDVIKEHPAGSQAFTKYQYDSLGRQVKQFIGFHVDVDESLYAEALHVIGDTIFEQSDTDYDDASNVIETRLRRRHHDATGTGELTTPSGSNPKARVSYVAHYSDAIGRQIAVANYGTNDDTGLSRSSTIPTRSDDILVTTTQYNDDGEAYKTIDPADKEDHTEFDDAGRVAKQIENYTDGDSTTGGNDEDITVEFTYTADGQQATITAKQKSSSDDQTTKYIYGTSLSDSDIARSDLLRAVIYPDSDDTCSTGVPPVLGNGPDGIYDRVEHRYNRQGEVNETKDQNETVHFFEFDNRGRQTHDRVTTLGTNIDGAVPRISVTYDVRGQVEKVTSHDNATTGSGNVVNEVLREYNDAGLLDKEYQEHDGAKDASTLYVGYNYDESATAGEFTKGLRPQSIRYPNGRLVHYTYGSSGSDADNLNRLDAIKDDDGGGLPGETLASYTYLGLGQMVIEDLEEPEVKLDYFGGTSGTYAGFDRFDRIVDQRRHAYAVSEDRDRFKYGYDRASNRVWKENTVSKNLGTPVYLDEFYTYDGVNRLTNMERGELNDTKTGITGTPTREEDWTLDPLGNWSNYIQKTSGTTDLDQDRTVNKANEITDVTETTGTAWPTPLFDRSGNMTSAPKPADLANSFECTWDGWNRLFKVMDGAIIVCEHLYDGLGRRVTKQGNGSVRHFLFSSRWQVLEERLDSSADPDRQFIWGPLYVDHLILRHRDTSDPNDGVLNERLYATQDTTWSVTGVVNKDGEATEQYEFEPYGQMLVFDPNYTLRSTSNSEWESGHTAQRIDNETGLCSCRLRWYAPVIGHFMSRDPVGPLLAGEVNTFRYVKNKVFALVDPFGLQQQPSHREPVTFSIAKPRQGLSSSFWFATENGFLSVNTESQHQIGSGFATPAIAKKVGAMFYASFNFWYPPTVDAGARCNEIKLAVAEKHVSGNNKVITDRIVGKNTDIVTSTGWVIRTIWDYRWPHLRKSPRKVSPFPIDIPDKGNRHRLAAQRGDALLLSESPRFLDDPLTKLDERIACSSEYIIGVYCADRSSWLGFGRFKIQHRGVARATSVYTRNVTGVAIKADAIINRARIKQSTFKEKHGYTFGVNVYESVDEPPEEFVDAYELLTGQKP